MMGFLTPLFLLGATLLVGPWLIHRIRRPERETVQFSSLMFVPNVKRETVERRRLQHVLLMLLRMALLALLALAFARPYREVVLGEEEPEAGVTGHVVLLDASMSMAAAGTWEEARKKAHELLDTLEPGDRVGVAAFGQAGRALAPVSEDLRAAHEAIDAAGPTWEKTDFAAGLQAAEQMLESGPQERRVVHLISDFQASGIPEEEAGWRLPASIRFNSIPVGKEVAANASVEALAARAVKDRALQVRARVRNWAGADTATVRLVVNGNEVERRGLLVPEGHASQVLFDVPVSPEGAAGYVEVIAGDALDRDDRRFFAWQPAAPHRVLVRSSGGRGATYDRLIAAAVPEAAGLPWRVLTVEGREWEAALRAEDPPSVVVAGDVKDGIVEAALAYVRAGGGLFLPLREGAQPEALNRLLSGMGMQVGPARFGRARPSAYTPMVWVNLEHPVFYPFRGARFNDFSSVRFYNSYALTAVDSPAVVLARFEDGTPAMAAAPLGEGRVIVWAGGAEPDWSNLARTPRFVPLLHETLRFLAGERERPDTLMVGDPARGVEGAVVLEGRLVSPGIVRKGPGGGRFEAVNVDPLESNPVRVTPAEVEIRLCNAPVLVQGEEGRVAGEEIVRHEYGYWGVMAMFALLLLEQGYAARLGSKRRSKG